MNQKNWSNQDNYNLLIKAQQGNDDPQFWTTQYCLGLIGEIDELLREINWKKHRKDQHLEVNHENIAMELADLTKYVMSLWQVWGFTLNEMNDYVALKSRILVQLRKQEYRVPSKDKIVVICDIDGTLADWRTSFIDWLVTIGVTPETKDPVSSMMLDIDLLMRYSDYYELKERFESSGGYRDLLPYHDAVQWIQDNRDKMYLIVTTARPDNVYHRIWADTWIWLDSLNIVPDELHIAHEPRILMANNLNSDHKVILIDDNPGILIRAANNGIKTYCRWQPYNNNLLHKNLQTIKNFDEIGDL
jgi:NTP pyrophosphatase (non-canonical NTP hydrolase)